MPRTPIPGRLIHRPEEVERNAERFDQLCRLAEEVAFPVVREALVRETAATGAEALTNEAKLALEALAEDAAALEGLDEQQILDEVQKSLSRAIPPPDEEEYYHADLVGLPCLDEGGARVGTVVAVENFGAGDMLEVERPDGKRALIPFREPIARLESGQILLDPEFLA